MKKELPIPENEIERLTALRKFKVLDTLPESRFDNITKLASIICQVPITLISLVDKDRLWFKSKIGFDKKEIPRETSFCQYAIIGDEIFEVENSLKDERFVNSPMVTGDPNIRFYAGTPLITSDGLNIGTLCVIDTVPRKLNTDQKEALRILAQDVMRNLELRKEKSKLMMEKIVMGESNQLLKTFFDNSPALIIMRSNGGSFTYVNQEAAKVIGAEINAIVGKTEANLMPSKFVAELLNDDREIILTKKGKTREFSITDNGESLYYLNYSFPLLNQQGDVYGVGSITNERTHAKKLELDLERSNERFLTIFKNSPVGMVISSNEDKKYLAANRVFLEMFGLEDETELIGKHPVETGLIPFKEIGRIAQLLSENNELLLEEMQCRSKRGREVTVLVSANNIELNGETFLLSSYIDVTEKKKLEQEISKSNDRFMSLFYNSPIGMTITDAETAEFKMANYSFLNMFGYSKDEIIGKKSTDLGITTDPNERNQNIQEIKLRGRVRDQEILAYKKNGEEIHLLTSIEFIEIDGRNNMAASFQDITKLKMAEEQLIVAKQAAEQATVSKSSFLANMSHEIRTPLNAMLGFSDLLEKTNLTDKQKEYLQTISSAGKNLMIIINDILDFSKIEAGMLSIENVPFSLQQLIQSIYTMFFARAQNKNLKLYMSVDPGVPSLLSGDPTRLNQILINLIGNAVKFTNEGSIKVDCELISKNKNEAKVQFSVTDTGIGIPQEKLETIFDRFTQADGATTRNFGGTGLGLSIAKKLVELHHGEITVNSVTGKGSQFCFTITYKIADEKEYAHKAQSEVVKHNHSVKGKKVLIVEDNPLNQKLALTLLTDEGFDVEVAENGQKAVDVLREKKFDIVLMDLQMPVLDGYQATKKIRSELQLKTPIIAMTANAMAGEYESCLSSGMDDYITKPFISKTLFNIIHKYLNINNREATENNTTVEQYQSTNKLTNLNYLRELSKGKESFVAEMITIFIDQNPKDIFELKESLFVINYDRIRALTHSMQTSISFVGLDAKIIDSLKFAEAQAIKKENIEAIREKLQVVIEQCENAWSELQEELEKIVGK